MNILKYFFGLISICCIIMVRGEITAGILGVKDVKCDPQIFNDFFGINNWSLGEKYYTIDFKTDKIISKSINTNEVLKITEIKTTDWMTMVGGKLYVSDLKGKKLIIIDTKNNLVTKNIENIDWGNAFGYTVVVGDKLYMHRGNGILSILDTNTDTIIDSIELGDTPIISVLVGKNLYIGDGESPKISILDTEKNSVIGTITLDGELSFMAYFNGKIYVTSSFGTIGSEIYVIDTTKNNIIKTITDLPQTGMLIGDITSNYLYIADGGVFSVIDSENDTLIFNGSCNESDTNSKLTINPSGNLILQNQIENKTTTNDVPSLNSAGEKSTFTNPVESDILPVTGGNIIGLIFISIGLMGGVFYKTKLKRKK